MTKSYKQILTFLQAILLLISCQVTQAAIITVKQDGTGDHTTIQAGIAAATDNDTVLVWPGTYYENLDFLGKDIALGSLYLTTLDEAYISTTIIDGNNTGTCIVIENSDSGNALVCGFTIQNGNGHLYESAGGGLLIQIAVVEVRSCVIQNNMANSGGGIIAGLSEIKLSGNIIRSNWARYVGGGLSVLSSTTIESDTISLNSIYLNYASQGSDIYKAVVDIGMVIKLDTFTVAEPDLFFVYSIDMQGNPLDDIDLSFNASKITPIESDLYVDPDIGSDLNSGFSPDDPFKHLYHALIMIKPDQDLNRTIHLASGTYSRAASGERLPINCRSYVSIVGQFAENTVMDAEYETTLVKSNVQSEQVILKNIHFTRGNGKLWVGNQPPLFIRRTTGLTLDSVIISSCTSDVWCALTVANSTHTKLTNSTIRDNFGNNPILLYNVDGVYKDFYIANCRYFDNLPDTNLVNPGSSKIIFEGDWYDPVVFKGTVVNLEVTENSCKPDPEWSPGCGLGIGSHGYVEVDLINLTVGNNTALSTISAALTSSVHAISTTYNSILYHDYPCEICYYTSGTSLPPGTTNILYSNIEGGEEGIVNPGNYQNINWLAGNMDEDPMWLETEPWYYALAEGSPCINAGVPMYEPGMDYPYIKEENENYVLYTLGGDTITLPPTDLAGNPRISGGRIDMGAYEFQEDTATNIRTTSIMDIEETFTVFPNPFRDRTFVSFKTPGEQYITIRILDVLGNVIHTLTDNRYPSGDYKLIWNGKDDSGSEIDPGSYIIVFYTNERQISTRKVIKKR